MNDPSPLSDEPSTPYRRIERALLYLAGEHRRQPSLAEAARQANLSEYHFQRLFSQWVGISPKRFQQFLSKEYIKSRLAQRATCLDAALDAGLSGPGRLHDLFVVTEAMTPGQYRAMGRGLVIRYGVHDSPFGACLLGVTDRGLCHLSFADTVEDTHASSGTDLPHVPPVEALAREWELATLKHDQALTAEWLRRVFPAAKADPGAHAGAPPRLLLRGTNFQLKVWEALLAIAPGEIRAYEDLAALAGQPAATRAAASAVARNRIAWLIPCHRVVRKIGASGEYRWGRARKKIMLAYERAQGEAVPDGAVDPAY